MNREEILERSRKENRNRDFYGQELMKQGDRITTIAMVIFATILMAVQIFIEGSINYGLYALIFLRSAVTYWVMWTKLRRRTDLMGALRYTILILIFAMGHIRMCIETSSIW